MIPLLSSYIGALQGFLHNEMNAAIEEPNASDELRVTGGRLGDREKACAVTRQLDCLVRLGTSCGAVRWNSPQGKQPVCRPSGPPAFASMAVSGGSV